MLISERNTSALAQIMPRVTAGKRAEGIVSRRGIINAVGPFWPYALCAASGRSTEIAVHHIGTLPLRWLLHVRCTAGSGWTQLVHANLQHRQLTIAPIGNEHVSRGMRNG